MVEKNCPDKSLKRPKSTERETSLDKEETSTKRSKVSNIEPSLEQEQQPKSEQDFQSVLDEADRLLNSPNKFDNHKDDYPEFDDHKDDYPEFDDHNVDSFEFNDGKDVDHKDGVDLTRTTVDVMKDLDDLINN